MKCTNCNKPFKFGKKSVRLFYFDKTFYFCSNNCYYKYAEKNHLSYWQWTRLFSKLTAKQKEKYQNRLRKVKNQIKKLRDKYNDENKVLHSKHDLIWVSPIKPGHDFDHVSKYKSFEDFKKAVITFLKKDTLKSIDSFSFCCNHNYKPSWQKKQIPAINKVFDELYGKDKVRWAFKEDSEEDYNSDELILGVYLKIYGKIVPLDYAFRYSIDTFIKRKLKNA